MVTYHLAVRLARDNAQASQVLRRRRGRVGRGAQDQQPVGRQGPRKRHRKERGVHPCPSPNRGCRHRADRRTPGRAGGRARRANGRSAGHVAPARRRSGPRPRRPGCCGQDGRPPRGRARRRSSGRPLATALPQAHRARAAVQVSHHRLAEGARPAYRKAISSRCP